MSRASPRAPSVSKRSRAPCGPACPARHGHEVLKFAVYFNFIVVYFKLAFQELLNVEQLGRPHPFLFLLGGKRRSCSR